MMDHKAEQEVELEALQSIYPDELTLHSNGEFELAIRSTETVDDEPISLVLHVKFSEKYPEQVPILRISDLEELPESYDEEETLVDLDQLIHTTSDEYLGMAMIFSIVSVVKDRLDELVTRYRDNLLNEEAERKRKAEEKENQKFIGTPVTVQSFLEWKRRFDAEMAANKPALVSSQRLSGRQLFEKDANLATSDMSYAEEGDIAVDLALFERELHALDLEEEDDDNINIDLSNLD